MSTYNRNKKLCSQLNIGNYTQFTDIKEGKEIIALAACNIITRDMKFLKVYVDKNHESVSASCEFIYTDEDSLRENIVNSMEVMGIVRTFYKRKCAELEN